MHLQENRSRGQVAGSLASIRTILSQRVSLQDYTTREDHMKEFLVLMQFYISMKRNCRLLIKQGYTREEAEMIVGDLNFYRMKANNTFDLLPRDLQQNLQQIHDYYTFQWKG